MKKWLDRPYYIGWVRPAVGLAGTWHPWVASEDEDLCRDLLRDFAPPGAHTVVLQAVVEPPRWISESGSHWD
jgi:hypothetical protein